jgi:xylulokinase
MLLLGIDVGTSAIKVSVVDAQTKRVIATTSQPDTEAEIIAPQPGWAEQSPGTWWLYLIQAINELHALKKYNPADIGAIGIAYQMHGLVCVDAYNRPLRNAIIWCDSRAVQIGNDAFESIGKSKSLQHLLNAPGNFTASKLAWVKKYEPVIYNKIHKVMLPGDFIAMQFTGHCTTTIPALSEGIFWDFVNDEISKAVMDCFDFDTSFIPEVQPLFGIHGYVTKEMATQLRLTPGIPVSYKAGDQPNNAASLNVMQPGEVAATAGTSGVIYGVSNSLQYDEQCRVNTFAHVNYTSAQKKMGVLLCVNGCGIMNSYIKNNFAKGLSYTDINQLAATVAPGSNGLSILPFGNGAERMFENKIPGATFHGLELNTHTPPHLYRAVQEGVAFSLCYGLDILKQNGIVPTVIRAGNANMFLSNVFADVFVNATGVPVELYNNDGSAGAALGAGLGAGIYKNEAEAFGGAAIVKTITPQNNSPYKNIYQHWKQVLNQQLSHL